MTLSILSYCICTKLCTNGELISDKMFIKIGNIKTSLNSVEHAPFLCVHHH